MLMIPTDISQTLAQLKVAADGAARAIPPVWPLASSVAVNPYLGQTGLTLAETAALMARVAGTPVTMPRSWHRERIASGAITENDLAAALAASPEAGKPGSVGVLLAAIARESAPIKAVPTVADLAAKASGIDWPGIIAERFGAWAGGYFDQGQALWAAPRGKGAYAAWQAVATHDLTPEIAGLTGFGALVADAPERAAEALASAVAGLQLPPAALETYFHSLLVTLGGWAHVARYELWQAELAGRSDETITDFLTIRLLWEQALLTRYGSEIGQAWLVAIEAHEEPVLPSEDQIIDAILQEAAERAAQCALAKTLTAPLSGFERQSSIQGPLCCRPRSASTCAPKSSAARSNRSTGGSRRSALPASSALPPRTSGSPRMLPSTGCRCCLTPGSQRGPAAPAQPMPATAPAPRGPGAASSWPQSPRSRSSRRRARSISASW